ncbi:4'-phosphopantetheinyl transferase superfamily protein [Catellatospora sp. KI3]|uniref:4'-phosphopantetheinyl transferase family protein n=1 Tax=Catellatospora sp. KI3 TaxID=3041620 RepID=UPI002482DD69|nr:4'-phosphopantetheinyl transferase superfamily protein [Catellatospora sp. KI3]MDI1464648.1 4'-phosphopantetheinyl transferase superfamily protein [Catellatospora sp. KI3]
MVIAVWWACPADVRPAHLDLLSDAERQRRAALRRPEDQARQTAAAALLRLAAGQELSQDPHSVRVERSCPDCAVPHGRPVLPGTGLHVSVSHSGDRIAVVLGRGGPLGVDVEQAVPDRDVAGLSRLALSPAELARGVPDQAGFYTYWTRKESVLKATGDGLRTAMTKIEVSAPHEPPRLHRYDGRPEIVAGSAMYTLSPGDGYHAALTVLDAAAPAGVTERDGSALLAGHQGEGL